MEGSVFVCKEPGQHLRDAAPKLIGMARGSGETITAVFNGIEIPVKPDDTTERVVEKYFLLFMRL